MLKLQNILLEYEQRIERQKNQYKALSREVRKLEDEREESQFRAEKTQDLKSVLAHQAAEWKRDIQSLKYVNCGLIMYYLVSGFVPKDTDGAGNRMRSFQSFGFGFFESRGPVML